MGATPCRAGLENGVVDASTGLRHTSRMSTITVAVPDPLDAAMHERIKAVGARSKEEYLLSLVEADCAASELEQVLARRAQGPFAPLPEDWKDLVRVAARERQ